MIWTVLQVAFGGALGAVARYLTGVATLRVMGPGFPWGTITVNIVGSFVMGLAVVLLAQSGNRFAPLVMTGVLGGFTTFSAFSLDAYTLFERGQTAMAASYVFLSVAFSLAGIVLGVLTARALS